MRYSERTYNVVCSWTERTRIEYTQTNPKTAGTKSHVRYEAYSKSKTVGEALELGSKPVDLLHDFEMKYIRVIDSEANRKTLASHLQEGETSWVHKLLCKFKGPDGESFQKKFARKRKVQELSKQLGIDLSQAKDEKNRQENTDMKEQRMLAEATAQKTLQEASANSRRITDKELIEVLRLWSFRKNESRPQVTPEGKTWVNSDTFGLIRTREGRFIATNSTRDYPSMMRILNRWLKDHIPADMKYNFPHTSISLNFGYAAKRHRDGNNHGPSMIKAFGNFKGGRLSYWPDDNKAGAVETLLDEDKVTMDLSTGLALFDGNRAHEVESFKGERFSVVYFTAGKYWKTKPEVQELLGDRGFEFPKEETMAYMSTILPPPKGYLPAEARSQSLAKMFGIQEKTPVLFWPVDTTTLREFQPYRDSELTQLPGMLEGKCKDDQDGEGASMTPPRRQPHATDETGSKLTPDERKRAAEGSLDSQSAQKKAKRDRPGALRDAASISLSELSSPEFRPEDAAREPSLCLSFALLARALEALDSNPGVLIPLTNYFRVLLHRSQDPQKDVRFALQLLTAGAVPLQTLVAGVVDAFGADAFGGSEPKDEDLAQLVLECRQQHQVPKGKHILTLSAAQSAISEMMTSPATQVAACKTAEIISKARAEGREVFHLVRLLQGRLGLPRRAVLRALAHAFVLSKPANAETGESAQRRVHSSAASLQVSLVTTDKAVALAFGETGGSVEQLVSALLANPALSLLYSSCRARCGTHILPMSATMTMDLDLVVAKSTCTAVLLERQLQGERVQVHKIDDEFTVFDAHGRNIGSTMATELMVGLRTSLRARECVVDAVRQTVDNGHRFFAFDCLWLDGMSLTRRSLETRHAALVDAVVQRSTGQHTLESGPQEKCGSAKAPDQTLQVAPFAVFSLEDPPTAEVITGLMQEARSAGCKGLMVKRLDREYEAGCSPDSWLALNSSAA